MCYITLVLTPNESICDGSAYLLEPTSPPHMLICRYYLVLCTLKNTIIPVKQSLSGLFHLCRLSCCTSSNSQVWCHSVLQYTMSSLQPRSGKREKTVLIWRLRTPFFMLFCTGWRFFKQSPVRGLLVFRSWRRLESVSPTTPSHATIPFHASTHYVTSLRQSVMKTFILAEDTSCVSFDLSLLHSDFKKKILQLRVKVPLKHMFLIELMNLT